MKSSAQKLLETSHQETLPMKLPKPVNTKRWYMRWWLWTLALFLVLAVGVGWQVRDYVHTFEQASGIEVSQMVATLKTGWDMQAFADTKQVHVVLFGIDETKNQREGSLLTDTIMLMSLNQSGEIDLISIPRDLWIDSLKTKINALYFYGEQSDETTGVELLTTVMEDITNTTIDYYLQLDLNTVRTVVDAVGGVDVYIEQGFIDERFPREGVDISSTDPSVLYETVEFEEGWMRMDGTTALKYIRSRQSENVEEGTDVARNRRQQQVIKALFARAQSSEFLLDPRQTGQAYGLWHEAINTNLPEPLLVALVKQWAGTTPSFESHQIPITDGGVTGLLYHPPVDKYGQWVYEPVDPTWQTLHAWMQDVLQS